MLRLTLRTLLAYLDDTLEPAQARQIGQKVAESEQARELIERIKQVTRRRRITTPPPGSKIEPNTIAEYLDNEVSPEQAAEVEQICLASDVHLAEVAACHQILTLVLGEPAKVPPAAVKRMYDLVKPPEKVKAAKPARAAARPAPEPLSEGREVDETLRLGLPALRRKDGWRNALLLVGGGLVAGVLLVVALWQVLDLPGGGTNNNEVVQADTDKNKDDKKEPGEGKKPPEKGSEPATDKKDGEPKEQEPAKKDSTGPKGKDVTSKWEPLALPDAAHGPANPKQAPIARVLPADPKEPSVLLQAGPEKAGWKRLAAKHPKLSETVYSGRPLVALPGSRGEVQLKNGLKLTLWSNAPPAWNPMPGPFRYESSAELHQHDAFDLEVTLRRGRVVLETTECDKPMKVRVRVENPMYDNQQEFFDLALEPKETAVVIDQWAYFPYTEPFYKSPTDPRRVGPTAELGLLVLAGHLLVKHGDVTYSMGAPPGDAAALWKSTEGMRPPFALKQAPDLARKPDPALQKALDEVAAKLNQQELDVVLAESVASPTPAVRRLAVLSLASLDHLQGMVEALDQDRQADLRHAAHEALRNWVALARGNDYQLYEMLQGRYKKVDAEAIMEMLHFFTAEELKHPARYETLIDHLNNRNLVIRELAHWHLAVLVPQGRAIPYSAAMDATQRAQAQARWLALIPPGQLPPPPPMNAPATTPKK